MAATLRKPKSPRVCRPVDTPVSGFNAPTALTPFPPPFHDLHERPAAQLVECEAGGQRFILRDRAAVQCAKEVVEQALAGGGVVEDIADERGLSCLLDEVVEPVRGRFQSLEEERVDGGVARRKLGGIEVPSLVVGVDERVADV